MNILIFSAHYPPILGGVGRYVKKISYALCDLGHKVTVVTSALHNDEGLTHENGITIMKLPCYGLLDGRLPLVKKNHIFSEMLRILQKSRYDLCMINTRFYPLSLYAARFAYKNHIKCFTLDHGSAHLTFGNIVLDFMENIYEHSITWLLKRYCKNFYGVSRDSEIFMEHFHIKSKGVLNNAIDIDEVNKIINENKYDIHSVAELPENCIIISYIGRLIYRKGVLELDRAVSQLIQKYTNIYLIYAGDGELNIQLQKQKSLHTIVLGQLRYEDAIKLMAQSDIFCLASETEGFPTAVLEAAACKTFIITTVNSGGAKDLVKSGSYGIVMHDNKPENIKRAIIKALDVDYRKKAVENCYDEAKRNYSWQSIAEKIIQMI